MFKANINLIVSFTSSIKTGLSSIRRSNSMTFRAKIKIVRTIKEARGELEETEFLVQHRRR